MLAILISILNCFIFRLRGGGFVTLTTTYCRLIWAAAFALTGFILSDYFSGNQLWELATLFVGGFLGLLVPHAAWQNMGRWATPQKAWPGFWMPTYTQLQWDAMPDWQKTVNDFDGMASVGFLRTLFFLLPTIILDLYLGGGVILASLHLSLAMAAGTFLQPAAYLLGKYTPWNFTWLNAQCTAFSSNWGEFWSGATYTIVLAIFVF